MSNVRPLVSIVTPCYNGEEFLDRYFNSIINQTYRPLELIFINDGSTDSTENIALSYSEKLKKCGIEFKYLFQENKGQAVAMNTGLKKVKGKYLVWPDSDDLLTINAIEKRVNFLELNPNYKMVRSNGIYFDYETKQKLYRISNLPNRFNEDIFMDLILEETYCACGCYMISVESFKEIYPDMKIYEAKEGQNWQILIPMTGRNICGYIDDDDYKIALRKESHSRKTKTLQQSIERLDGLKDILIQSIYVSKRKDKNYINIVEDKYNKLKFRCYLNYNDINNGNEYFQLAKKANNVSIDDYWFYLEKTNHILYKIKPLYDLCLRIYAKIKREIMR